MKKKTVKKILKKKVAPRRKPTKKLAKKIVKKVATKKKVIITAKPKSKPAKPIGVVTHFYNEISVAIVRFKEPVPLGAVLSFKGATTDFEHPVQSMQYDHKPIKVAPKGKQIGIKVKKRVRKGDKVHRIK
jgi:hypothetical protein